MAKHNLLLTAKPTHVHTFIYPHKQATGKRQLIRLCSDWQPVCVYHHRLICSTRIYSASKVTIWGHAHTGLLLCSTRTCTYTHKHTHTLPVSTPPLFSPVNQKDLFEVSWSLAVTGKTASEKPFTPPDMLLPCEFFLIMFTSFYLLKVFSPASLLITSHFETVAF